MRGKMFAHLEDPFRDRTTVRSSDPDESEMARDLKLMRQFLEEAKAKEKERQP